MRKILLAISLLSFALATYFILNTSYFKNFVSGAPPYLVVDPPTPAQEQDEMAYLKNWKRPIGPARVGLQVGHWKNDEVPEELNRLIRNTGATGGGKAEWEVNYAIASATAQILEKQGVAVDLLPATVPEKYWADAFVAIHADGNLDPSQSGFKAASPRRDYTGKAQVLLSDIESAYGEATHLPVDPNVTRNMRGYYAFSWWRFDHAIHPMTAGVILETGFLTSPSDRKTVVQHPEVSAQGLASGIMQFLRSEGLL